MADDRAVVDLDENDKRTALCIARDTLQWSVAAPTEPFAFSEYQATPTLMQNWTTFVTLRWQGALRGCVGGFEPVASLMQSGHDNTLKAAREDPRFPAVSADEVEDIHVHLSILSVLRKVHSLEAFGVGRHGLLMTLGKTRSVFLPEVAAQQNWTPEETAAALCRKAGLQDDAWRQGAKFSVFTSTIIEED